MQLKYRATVLSRTHVQNSMGSAFDELMRRSKPANVPDDDAKALVTKFREAYPNLLELREGQTVVVSHGDVHLSAMRVHDEVFLDIETQYRPQEPDRVILDEFFGGRTSLPTKPAPDFTDLERRMLLLSAAHALPYGLAQVPKAYSLAATFRTARATRTPDSAVPSLGSLLRDVADAPSKQGHSGPKKSRW